MVDVWKVGTDSPISLPLTPLEISAHLLNDWLPEVPAGQGSAFMGWPERLLVNEMGRLQLSELVTRTERQWKGFISWMLGVAGARTYLKEDGYRWIAPISAFFENAVQPVNVPTWYLPFPKPRLTTTRRENGILCADYLAARSSAESGALSWAVVEAKGTNRLLDNLTRCLPNWETQVRNLRIQRDGSELIPDRYLVVATRVNSRGRDRRVRIRAWNNEEMQDNNAFSLALPDLVCAHLFGFYYGVGLLKVAEDISSSVRRRAARELHEASPAWLIKSIKDDGVPIDEVVPLGGGETTVLVELSMPLRRLTASLISVESQHAALDAIRIADQQLDNWWEQHQSSYRPNIVALPFGIRAKFVGPVR